MPEIAKKILDNDGNAVMSVQNGNIIRLYLKLKAESRRREIGFVNENTKTLHIKRNRSKHLFRKLNAYGFCYRILELGKKFDKIRLEDETGEWLIPKDFLMDKSNHNTFLHFKGNGGFEVQIFAPLENIEQFRRPQRF